MRRRKEDEVSRLKNRSALRYMVAINPESGEFEIR